MLTCSSEHSVTRRETQLLLQKQIGPVLPNISRKGMVGLKAQAEDSFSSRGSFSHRTWHIACSIEKVVQLGGQGPML